MIRLRNILGMLSRPLDPGTSQFLASQLARWRAGRINLWMLLCILALSGWLVDGLLTSLQLHQAGGGWGVHLFHLWYVPPILLALLLPARKRIKRLAVRVAEQPTLDALTQGLRPEIKALAQQVVSAPTKADLLTFLRSHTGTAMTSVDLAHHVGKDRTEAEQALADLAALGLVEIRCVCDMTFYKLTSDREQLARLDELEEWQADWLTHAGKLAQVAGAKLRQQ